MAKVTKSMTKDFEFIDWDGRPGSVGEFDFEAEPGTLLTYGQKDIRKGRGGVDGYRICMPDGSMPRVSDSQVMALKKLAVEFRCAAAAKMLVDLNEQYIATMPAEKLSDSYYAGKVDEARKLIEQYRPYAPISAV
jgi:hypothetical protein